MNKNKKAFTLVELLVVVLIIGILATIAVPQYQTAVKVSRVKSALSVARTLYDAEEVFYLANGHYTKDLSQLDVSMNYNLTNEYTGQNCYTADWGSFCLYDSYNYISLVVNNIVIDFYNRKEKSGIIYYGICYRGNDVCSKFGGQISTPASSHWSGTNVYYMTI